MHYGNLQPTRADLEKVFRLKYGDPQTTGWSPKMRFRFGYFTPDDFYEALVSNLVNEGYTWIDVGSGKGMFPHNKNLSRVLAGRCAILVGLDPCDNLDKNPFLHQRVQGTIESFHSEHSFDLATLRMVAEHIANPELAALALSRLIKPGGKVIIYTVNKWSPITIISRIIPFRLHYPMLKLINHNVAEEDVFPTAYKMNTRKQLLNLFQKSGFKECYFAYLDDSRLFYNFRTLHLLELLLWRLLKAIGISYPENCLIGIYEKIEQ
ncbi:MAG: class I SAM-dependent methyltransferase [Nitrospirota bacterium]